MKAAAAPAFPEELLVASWRPIDQNRCATRVGGLPSQTRVEAEEACEAMLEVELRLNLKK